MDDKATISSFTDAIKLMDTALSYGKPIALDLVSKDSAAGVRFRCYRARVKLRKLEAAAAGIPVDSFRTRYDDLLFHIRPTTSELDDHRWTLHISHGDAATFKLYDPETNQELELNGHQEYDADDYEAPGDTIDDGGLEDFEDGL